jgi:hypothetical protein
MSSYTPTTRMVRPTVRVENQVKLSTAGRRFVRSAIILAVATAGFIATANGFGASNANANSSAAQVSFQYVTVSAGQDLWSMAEELAPNRDPRDWIVDVVNLNGLGTTEVQPGQKIALPN